MFGSAEEMEEDGGEDAGLSPQALALLNGVSVPQQSQGVSPASQPIAIVELLKQNALNEVLKNPDKFGGPEAVVKLLQAKTAEEVFKVLNPKKVEDKPRNSAEVEYKRLTTDAKNLAKNRELIAKELSSYRADRQDILQTMKLLENSWSLSAYRELRELKSNLRVLDGLVKDTELMLLAMEKEEVKLGKAISKLKNSIRSNYLHRAVSGSKKQSKARRAVGRLFGAKPVFDSKRFVEEDFAKKMVA